MGRITLAVALLVLVPVGSVVANDESPQAGPGSTALRSAEELLEAQGFAILPGPVKQIFVPYLNTDRMPVFVTSDSILSAYATILEASFTRLAWQRSSELPEVLRTLVQGLDGQGLKLDLDEKLVGRARERARLALAVALGLLGEPLPDLDDESRALVATEVLRVEAAQGQAFPDWLGPSEVGFLALDYDRFRPRGLYAEYDALRRHFRATAWLQAIPWRIARDEEHVALLLLAQAASSSRTLSRDRRSAGTQACYYLRALERLVGRSDDLPFQQAAWFGTGPINAGTLARHKEKVAKWAAKRVAINDQVAVAPLGLNARILPASRLPDAVLFQVTCAPAPTVQSDRLPTGVEVAAALGSKAAGDLLSEGVRARIAKAPPLIDPAPKYESHRTGYERVLIALRTLFEPPDPAAPPLFASEAWQLKTCQTVLGAWALVRRTMVLHAKPTVCYGGAGGFGAGFVEPVPAFYARLRRAAAFHQQAFRGLGVFDAEPARYGLASDLRVAARRAREPSPPDLRDRDAWGSRAVYRALRLAFPDMRAAGIKSSSPEGEMWGTRVAEVLEELAADLVRADADLDAEILRHLKAAQRDLDGLWTQLSETCWQLEVLAHKQLRKQDFDKEENTFLRQYGRTLGHLHLYGGNAYLRPDDDAPKVVDVFSDPFTNMVVHAAVGRPQRIVLRYPWMGKTVDCAGCVLTYFEPRAAERLDDAAWRGLLDGGAAERPPWVRGLFAAAPDADEQATER